MCVRVCVDLQTLSWMLASMDFDHFVSYVACVRLLNYTRLQRTGCHYVGLMGSVLVPPCTLKTECNGKKVIDIEVRVEMYKAKPKAKYELCVFIAGEAAREMVGNTNILISCLCISTIMVALPKNKRRHICIQNACNSVRRAHST